MPPTECLATHYVHGWTFICNGVKGHSGAHREYVEGKLDHQWQAGPMPLTEQEQAILAFERRWWKYQGAKEQAIKDELEMSAPRYYQLLIGVGGLIDNPAALAADPVTVKRLQRLRSGGRQARRAE